ncbi:MAG: hypothetical protein KC550_02450 [Nanoarchaeota archaeon]|nr:hypothetical protein [Nanoarchaeota archaeon]
MEAKEVEKNRKSIVFISSFFVNLAKLFASNNSEYDIFLILDRRFPFDIEDDNLENFYSYIFDKKKIFEKDKEKYFDNLSLFINEFNPDIIIANNFSKLFPQSFLDFQKFRNSNINIINIHHADLRIFDEKKEMKYKGLSADIKEFLEESRIITTIHKIENKNVDEGKQLAFSHETTLKELKQKNILHKKEDIINLRIRNVVLSYHERTKVLKLLKKIIENI